MLRSLMLSWKQQKQQRSLRWHRIFFLIVLFFLCHASLAFESSNRIFQLQTKQQHNTVAASSFAVTATTLFHTSKKNGAIIEETTNEKQHPNSNTKTEINEGEDSVESAVDPTFPQREQKTITIPTPSRKQSSSLPYKENNDLFDRRTVTRNAVAWIAGIATTIQWLGAVDDPEKQQQQQLLPMQATIASSLDTTTRKELQLEYIPTLGAYVVNYSLFGERFSAIVDTGSPFLTVPSYCKPYRIKKMFWGCYKPELTKDSGYGNTIEGFDNNYGTVVWRRAEFSFSEEVENEIDERTDVVFGVLDSNLLNGSGGVFFGLIKETDKWIRPSFLSQMGYKSFCIDLRKNNSSNNSNSNSDSTTTGPRLVLSKESMIGTGQWRRGAATAEALSKEICSEEIKNSISLVRDLKSKYGAPVVHYTAKATKFMVNGMPLLISKRKPLYVIFDSGVSGMVVSQELYNGRYLQARKNREKSLWGAVEVSFETAAGNEVTLKAQKPLTTPLGKANPWKGFQGNLIAIGLAFLDGLAMTIDVDGGKILFADE